MGKRLGAVIRSSDEAAALFSAYKDKRQEHFLAATLNGAHRVINVHVVAIGTVNRTILAPREVFYPAIVDNAVAVIVAHNHPSCQREPSPEDDEVTARVVAAGELLGIHVLDHIIVAGDDYYSYSKERRMGGEAWEDMLAAERSTLKTQRSCTSSN
jgi:DNA repair protein RadC